MTAEEMLAVFEAASPEAQARALRIAKDSLPFMVPPVKELPPDELRELAAEVLVYS